MRRLVAAWLLFAPAASAEDIRSEKPAFVRVVPATPGVLGRGASFEAALAWVHDDNIRRLLTNSAVNSGTRTPDDILRTSVNATLNPGMSGVPSEFSYTYDRSEFQRHALFSYYSHAFEATVRPKIHGRWRLDLGAACAYLGDAAGRVSSGWQARVGTIWHGPRKLRLRFDYSYRRDDVATNGLKSSNSSILLLDAHFRPKKGQTAFVAYRLRLSAYMGPDFSYRSHSLQAGVVSRWTPRWSTTVVMSGTLKDYDNIDDRFLIRRRDRLLSAAVSPSFAFTRWLNGTLSATFLEGRSNVAMKNYSDQVYSAILQTRF